MPHFPFPGYGPSRDFVFGIFMAQAEAGVQWKYF
jgi:hypothetical protein